MGYFIKMAVGTILFIVAVLLLLFWGVILYTLYVDSTPSGLLGIKAVTMYTEDEQLFMLGAFIIPPTISLCIFLLLWKTNFFSRDK